MVSGNSATFTAHVKSLPSHSLHSCSHTIQFYYDDRFLIASLSDFVRRALGAGRSVLVVATREHRFETAERLRQSGINLTLAIEHGRYLALDACEMLDRFMVNGSPDPQRFQQGFAKIISTYAQYAAPQAIELHSEISIFGEMVAVLLERGEVRAALLLEKLWNEFSCQFAFDLLCGYRISNFDRTDRRELFHRICAEHNHVMPAEGYPDRGNEDDRLRTIALLQQTEQVLKTESVERQLAEAKTRETEHQKQGLLKELHNHEAVEEELRNFTRRLLASRDEEQRRIAAELHENMAQLVAALSLYFGVIHQEQGSLNPRLAQAVADSRSVSDSLFNEIRKLSRLLHPPTLDDLGLGIAVRDYIDHLNCHGARIELEAPSDLGRFDRYLELTAYRIVEEALENFSPSRPDLASTVRLMRSQSSLLLEIEIPQTPNSHADASRCPEPRFTGIHERVMEHRGSVHFTSTPSGTLISVSLPLRAGLRRSVPGPILLKKAAS